MKTFEIQITRRLTRFSRATIEVTAVDEDEACELAIERGEEDRDVTWEDDEIEPCDEPKIEIDDIEEIPDLEACR